MLTKRKQYPDLYSWSHALGKHVLAHQDGAVSVYLDWDGFDVEMMSEHERSSVSSDLLTALNSISPGYCAEFHFWREWDASLAETYRQQKIQRGGKFATAIRNAQADHLSNYGMSNQVGLVLTKEPKRSFWGGAKTALKNQSRSANELIDAAGTLASRLPGGRFAPCRPITTGFDKATTGGASIAGISTVTIPSSYSPNASWPKHRRTRQKITS